MESVAVVGASPKEDRYSYKAMKMLLEAGHNAIPVAPAQEQILGKKAYASLSEVPDQVTTVTMYVGPARQGPIIEDLLVIKPRRIIFNPGTENSAQYERLRKVGIECIEACTLVLLRTDQF
jgi:uncharacterized protein